VSGTVRQENDTQEAGNYLQLYHEIEKYLAGEIGAGWSGQMTIAPADAKADPLREPVVYVVKVGLETLHVEVCPQGPDKPGGALPTPPRYGVVEIKEFPISQAGKFQQMEGITGVVRTIGGNQAASNLQQVIGVGGAMNGRQTPMQIKCQVLPLVRDPDAPTLGRGLLHLWPVRNDPVVQARLESIAKDARYAPEMQRRAQDVLESRVPPEDLIAAGVNIDN
jgi:hypothetical protein